MKKLLINLVLTACCILPVANSVFAVENSEEALINEKIASIGFGKIFVSDPQKEIETLFKKLDSYSLKKDLKNIRTYFSDDFVSNDGYDIDTYMKSVKNGFESYNARSVTTKILSIAVNDDFAVVHVCESGEAETTKPAAQIEGNGLVLSSADIYYFLKKEANKWKITSANVLDENCSILYGAAKNVYFSLNVPTQIKAGCEYTSSLSFAPMKDIFVMASLSKDPIVYPLPLAIDSFKSIKRDGILERIFTSNTDGYNEYAIASIGMTRADMLNSKIELKIIGSAYVIRRVNVFKPMPQNYSNAKKNVAAKNLNVTPHMVKDSDK
ncbi:MAG: nuclear transport factor 2 family protein, partial [Candidatus Gastranaerophilaceae bacterium]